jgi:Na+/proline symporter
LSKLRKTSVARPPVIFSWCLTVDSRLKRRAPNAHTFLEVIKARYGVATHIVFLVFGLMTNILVTAMLLTGGSAVASSLCGVPTAAACFLLPIGVVRKSSFWC